MIKFALDTNIISYLIQKDSVVLSRFNQEVDKGNECIIPPVAYYEIKRGLIARNAITKAAAFERMCNVFEVGEMNTTTWDEAARLYAFHRQQGSPVEDADLFIAAFCLTNDYILVTNNTKHFSLIDGLQLVNWKK